jgi:hypothetical protein
MRVSWFYQARIRRYLRAYRWLTPVCIIGIVMNLYSAIIDFRNPTGWWSWLFGALSILCAGVCALVWFLHHRLARKLKQELV